MAGCCAGRPTSARFGLDLPDLAGVRIRRIPAQLLEAGWAAIAVAVAIAVGAALDGDDAGAVFAVVIALYGVGRAALEHARQPDPGRSAAAVNLWVAGGLVAAGTAILAAVTLA